MGSCLSIEERKNTGDTVDPETDRNGKPPAKPIPPRTKKNRVIEKSTIDDTIIQPKNSDRHVEPSHPILLPDNPSFKCSANGRNGYSVNEVYDFGETVRIETFLYLVGIKHSLFICSLSYDDGILCFYCLIIYVVRQRGFW